jgi:sugar phosphate isomerase/epimerase
LSFSTGSVYVYPLTAAFALAQQAGLAAVELVLGAESLRLGARQTESLAARYGLTIRSLHPPIAPLPGWPNSSTAAIQRLLAYATQMSAPPLLVLHTPHARNLQSEPGGIRYLETLAAWRKEFSQVPIALETPGLFGEKSRRFALFQIAALTAFAEQQGALLTLDTAHVGSMPHDLLDAYRQMRERLANIHFSDLRALPRLLDHSWTQSYIKHHQLPGHGRLPLTELVRALHRDHYQGMLTFELSPLALRIWSPRQALQRLVQCVAFVRRIEQAAEP